ncbi:MAG TPA: shikimate kinase [Methanomassiliicoccales archaeon]|jgi:shikimate kinase
MNRTGKGESHGAATIVNAIATGKGAAFGIDLKTWAEVNVLDSPKVEVSIEGFSREPTRLVENCFRAVIDKMMPGERPGAKIVTRSQIPVSRGLKSSSAAANAVIMATLDALGEKMEPLEAIRLGTKCAIDAGVSVTGAFDDACAAWLGGAVVTDNRNDELLRREPMDPNLKVVIHVPPFQTRKSGLPRSRISAISDVAEMAFQMALKGDYLGAMKLNGLCYASALSVDQEVAFRALELGARSAGLSGTGPATAILVDSEKLEKFLSDIKSTKEFIITDIFNGANA